MTPIDWGELAELLRLAPLNYTSPADLQTRFSNSRDEAHHVEIVYFGLAPESIGRALGGALLTDALERAWVWEARRVWVHTCTLDHPAAVKSYEARGMTVYDRQTEETG